MEIATFVLAVLGLVLAVVGLVWQFATFRLSGGRVKVLLKVGVMAGQTTILGSAKKITAARLHEMMAEHGGIAVVAVEVRNVGRMPVTVRSWGLKAPSGTVLTPVTEQVGPDLKHTIDAGDMATWAIPFVHARNLAKIERLLPGAGGTVWLIGVVELADGRTAATNEALTFAADGG